MSLYSLTICEMPIVVTEQSPYGSDVSQTDGLVETSASIRSHMGTNYINCLARLLLNQTSAFLSGEHHEKVNSQLSVYLRNYQFWSKSF